jgi:hypothetical protein
MLKINYFTNNYLFWLKIKTNYFIFVKNDIEKILQKCTAYFKIYLKTDSCVSLNIIVTVPIKVVYYLYYIELYRILYVDLGLN